MTTRDEVYYPECTKLHAVRERSQVCGEFITWLRDELNIELCEQIDEYPHYRRTLRSLESLFAEFFKIDLDKVEQEKRAMLAKLSKAGEYTP